MIKQHVRSYILNKYKLSDTHFLGKGQEAEVYSYMQDKVLKIHDATVYKKQTCLKSFYESMEIVDIGFDLPKIFEIIEEKEAIITIEKKIEGRNIQKDLSTYDSKQLDSFFKQYLAVICGIKEIKINQKIDGFKLVKDYEINSIQAKDWNEFLKQSLIHKNKEVQSYLRRDVKDYEQKYEQLVAVLSTEYKGDYSLIHGDYYPSNLLVNEEGKINGVIDFGLMTMYGDYLFDVALSWLLFDLYEEIGEIKLTRYFNMIVEKVGEEQKSKLYFYALYYSLYSANFFSDDCSDGHYHWSVRNLNNEKYWSEIENLV